MNIREAYACKPALRQSENLSPVIGTEFNLERPFPNIEKAAARTDSQGIDLAAMSTRDAKATARSFRSHATPIPGVSRKSADVSWAGALRKPLRLRVRASA